MSYLVIAGNVLTVCGILLAILESHLDNENKIITTAITRSAIGMVSYLCLGAYVGIANQFIVFSRSIYLKKKEMTFKVMIVFQIIFTVLAFTIMENKFGIISWISGLFGTYSYYILQRNKKKFRMTRIVCLITSICYSITISNYVSITYSSYMLIIHSIYTIKEIKKEQCKNLIAKEI